MGEKSCTSVCLRGWRASWHPPDKSKIDEEKNRKTNVGLDSEAWVSTQDELIDFVANIAGIEEKRMGRSF